MAFRVTARGPRAAEILLYEDVGEWLGGISASAFHAELRALGAVDTLTLRINSLGGDAFDGLAIYQQLRQYPARKVVQIDSIAASIASIIAMAGDEIRIARPAQVMIHEAAGRASGPAAKHRELAQRLEAITATLADIYAQRTRQPAEKLREWMAAETYFSAAEAVANGFADSIVDGERIAAHFDPSRHSHIARPPAALLAPQRPRPVRDTLAARLAAQRARLSVS